MAGIPVPENSFLRQLDSAGVRGGRKLWRRGSRFYSWDSLHGEVEVFNKRGDHLGSLDPVRGQFVKDAVKGRRLDL